MRKIGHLVKVTKLAVLSIFVFAANVSSFASDDTDFEYSESTPTTTLLETIYERSQARGAIRGNPDGTIVLYEFFDYNCPYCSRADGFVSRMIDDYPDLKVVLVDAPVLGSRSKDAAQTMMQVESEAYAALHGKVINARGRVDHERIVKIIDDTSTTLPDSLREDNTNETTTKEIAFNLSTFRRYFRGVPGFYLEGDVVKGVDEIALEKLVCGYTVMGSCSSMIVLLDDIKQSMLPGNAEKTETFVALTNKDLERRDDSAAYYYACWYSGRLYGADFSTQWCDEAVSRSPRSGVVRESRAINFLVNGRMNEAIADMKYVVDFYEKTGYLYQKSLEHRTNLLSAMEINDLGAVVEPLKSILSSQKYYSPLTGRTFAYSHTDELTGDKETHILNALGEPALNSNSIYGWSQKYDKNGNRTELTYRGINAEKIDNDGEDNIATFLYKYDDDNNQILRSFFDAEDQPAPNENGVFAIASEYKDGKKVAETFLDSKGDAMNSTDGYSKVIYKLNDDKDVEASTYLDVSGKLITHDRAIWRNTFNDEGQIIAMQGEDETGKLRKAEKTGRAFVTREYDGFGNLTVESSFTANKEPVNRLDTGWSICKWARSRSGKSLSTQCYKANGSEVDC